jgi:preprotein translocase subunit SecG
VVIVAASGWAHFLNFGVILVGIFLAFIILIQRGKGGGLAGAFGGPGGSSAFGSRSGDAFMRFTIWVAAVWIIILMIQVKVIKSDSLDRQQESSIGRT